MILGIIKKLAYKLCIAIREDKMKINRLLAFAVGTAMIISMSPAVVLADEAESSEPAETTVVESSEPSEKETPKVSETEPAKTDDHCSTDCKCQ